MMLPGDVQRIACGRLLIHEYIGISQPTIHRLLRTVLENPAHSAEKGGVGKVLLILVAVLVVMGILGAVFGGSDKTDDKPAAAAATTVTTTQVPDAADNDVGGTLVDHSIGRGRHRRRRHAPAPSPRPAVPASDPRCAPANESLVAPRRVRVLRVRPFAHQRHGD
jgi:hypothetical protein